MPGVKPIDPLLTRALKRAIAYCHDMFDGEMSALKPGAAPTSEALAWRSEGTEYNRLLAKLQPRREAHPQPYTGQPPAPLEQRAQAVARATAEARRKEATP